MKALIVALLMGSRLVGICFVGVLFALGSAHADTGKGAPTTLKPLKSTPVASTPVITTTVDQQPEAPRVTRQCVFVSQSSAMPADTGQFLPGVYLQSCCPGCASLNVQALFISPSGGISSQSQQEVCQYQQ